MHSFHPFFEAMTFHNAYTTNESHALHSTKDYVKLPFPFVFTHIISFWAFETILNFPFLSYPFCLLTLLGTAITKCIVWAFVSTHKELYLLLLLSKGQDTSSPSRGSPTTYYLRHWKSWTPSPPLQSNWNAATLHSTSHQWCQGNHQQVQHVCVRKLEHWSHFSLIFSLWTLPPFYLSLHFPFTYCSIDSILFSPLCSSWPVL